MLSFVVTLLRLARVIGRSGRDPEVRALLVLFGFMLLSGTLFYTNVEGWTVLDALYFSVVTMSTVGFGDLTPGTTIGKIFTIIYLLTGVGIFVALVSKLAAEFLRQSMSPAVRKPNEAGRGHDPYQRRASAAIALGHDRCYRVWRGRRCRLRRPIPSFVLLVMPNAPVSVLMFGSHPCPLQHGRAIVRSRDTAGPGGLRSLARRRSHHASALPLSLVHSIDPRA
jgi:hypothetical protein